MNPGASRVVAVASWPSQILEEYRAVRGRGDAPPLERFWSERAGNPGPETLAALAVLIKEDLRHRFAQGERPAVADYLERFPILRQSHDRMISLVYEEFCLREEHGERPEPESFCRRYEPWRDSLLSQLGYHDAFSRLASTPPEPPCFPEPGGRFRRFRLCGELGRGGVARVYLARDDELGGRKFALKLSPDHGAEPSIQGRLDHPHIVAVTHVEREPESGLRGLCMPYWPGLPLNEVINRIDPARRRPRNAEDLWHALGTPVEEDRDIEDAGRPTWGDYPRRGSHADAVGWVGLKLAEALAHAHARGIIHRDIKPANILLTRRGGPLLLDFNLAHASRHVEEADAANRGGTLPYMAPEQLRAFLQPEDWDRVSPTADLFSLGLVLRELLIGEQPPLPTPGLPADLAVWELLDLRDRASPPPLRSVNRAVPHAFEAILARCLAAGPEDRYPDAETLAEDLRRFLKRRPLKLARNPSLRERAGNWAHRHRLALGPAVLCLAIAPPIYSGALLLNPGQTYSSLIKVGSHEARNQRLDSAQGYFEKALERNPKGFEAHQGLGAVYSDREEYEESVRHYARAISLAEGDNLEPVACAMLHHDYALTLGRWGRETFDRSIAEYLESRTLEGPVAQLSGEADRLCFQALAELKKADGELDAAGLRDALSAADRDRIAEVRCKRLVLAAQLHKWRGEIASLADRYHESVPLFREAKELVSEAVAAYERLALGRLRDFELALPPPVDNLGDIPVGDGDQILVAEVRGMLVVRILEGGHVLAETTEAREPEKARAFARLKSRSRTLGEASTLSRAEREEVIAAVVSIAAPRIPNLPDTHVLATLAEEIDLRFKVDGEQLHRLEGLGSAGE